MRVRISKKSAAMNYKTFLNISPIQIPNLLGAAFLELSGIVSEVYICAKDNASATKRKRPPVIIADSLSPNSTLRRAFKKMRESGESSSIDDKSILFDVATNQLQLLRAVLCLDKFAETVRDAIYSFGRDEQERLFLRALDAVQQDIINDGYITARIDVIRQWAGESVNLDLFVHECEQLQYQLHQISEHIQRFVDSSSLVESSTSFDLEAIKSRIHARLDPSMNRTPDCVREKLYTELYSVESMFAERFADVEKHKLDTISQPIEPVKASQQAAEMKPTKPTLRQIAYIYRYKGEEINERNKGEIAAEYGYNPKSSGHKLLEHYNTSESQEQRTTGRDSTKNIRNAMESLTGNGWAIANDELSIAKGKKQ